MSIAQSKKFFSLGLNPEGLCDYFEKSVKRPCIALLGPYIFFTSSFVVVLLLFSDSEPELIL